jgi:hypothetical protein
MTGPWLPAKMYDLSLLFLLFLFLQRQQFF